jgi:hypothetical protein
MTLEDKLAEFRAASAKRHPPERRAIMAGATQALRDSGAVDRVVKVGDPLPAFSLQNAQGVEIHSEDLLSHGPLVLTVFRGVW